MRVFSDGVQGGDVAEFGGGEDRFGVRGVGADGVVVVGAEVGKGAVDWGDGGVVNVGPVEEDDAGGFGGGGGGVEDWVQVLLCGWLERFLR